MPDGFPEAPHFGRLQKGTRGVTCGVEGLTAHALFKDSMLLRHTDSSNFSSYALGSKGLSDTLVSLLSARWC